MSRSLSELEAKLILHLESEKQPVVTILVTSLVLRRAIVYATRVEVTNVTMQTFRPGQPGSGGTSKLRRPMSPNPSCCRLGWVQRNPVLSSGRAASALILGTMGRR